MRNLIAGGLVAFLVLGCADKGEEPPADPTPTSGTAAEHAGKASAKGADDGAPVQAGAWREMTIAKLGVIAMVPGDAKASRLGGITALNHSCQAMMNQARELSPSFENTLKNVEKGHRGGMIKEMIRKQKTDDDNFVVEYSTTKGKWGYESRSKVGAKIINCGRVSSSKEGHQCVVKVCESLKSL